MTTTCPKCGYQRQPRDHNTHTGLCPNCGIAYNKWVAREQLQDSAVSPSIKSVKAPEDRFFKRLAAELFYVPEQVVPWVFWSRVICLALFALWGLSFMPAGINWDSIGGSFMHNVNLPFHEFGHVLFRPFGRFMTILGGSLFQVVMPLGLLFAFLIQRRDTFAASLMLWWSGQSFIDLAPYIADAPYRSIPLVRGMDESGHDWGNLLTMTNSLNSAMPLARFSFGIGCLLIIIAICWGAYVLWLQKQRLREF